MSGFQDIYENYSKPVYRFLLSLTRKEEMAEELLQETFYRAFFPIWHNQVYKLLLPSY